MKKLVINAPLCADRVIGLLNGYDSEGIRMSYISKEGMKLYFDVEGIEGEQAISMAKKMIRDTDWGRSLYFYVTME